MKKLLLIDGSNIMFRAYYATAYSGNLMQNSKGEYTNAVFGLANMLNLILTEDFTHVLVAFDKGKATFRHKDYEAYKAGRKAMPDEFKSQLPKIREIIDRLGFFQYEREDVEADDIIGTIATRYYNDFDEIEIISNDKDLFQLLNDKVTIRLSKRGIKPEQSYTVETLKQELEITPHQIPDLKGLMGDSSDNLPGIPGVGEKTALKLLKEFNDVETLLQNTQELKGKLKERVSENADQAMLCKRLATLITDAELDIKLDDMVYTGFDTDALISFYQRMEFHSLIKRLDTKEDEALDETIKMIKEEKDLEKAFAEQNTIVLECFGDNYHHTKPLGFAWKNTYGNFYMTFDQAIVSERFTAFLMNDTLLKTTFDLKALRVILLGRGIDLKGIDFDVLLAAYVLNPSNTKEDFKVVVQNFDYHDVPYQEEIYGKGAKAKVPSTEVIKDYAMKKVFAIDALKDVLDKKINAQDQASLLFDVEMPLAGYLADMEFYGIRIDQDALKALDESLASEIEAVTKQIHELAGESFNVSSPKQLGVILFEKLNLPSFKKSKTGYSTNIDVLNKLRKKHPIIEPIMKYRSLTKLQSTYVRGLSEATMEDGKIHTIYKQAFTQTGRLSSIEPNLQNIPIRTELGRDIRKVFIPEKGHVLLAADYSQIELRILAHLADEKQLIKAFEADEDIHTITGQEIFDKKEISSNERRIAKAVNFGIIYGQSAWGLSDDLDISIDDAKRFIDRYYHKFPGIAKFMDSVIDGASVEGYVKTMLNRRRYIPELNSRIYAQKEFGKRTAMNAPIQGSAADLIKIAMVKVAQEMDAKQLQSKLVLQIHDELVFNVKEDEREVMKQLVKDVMESAFDLSVPLRVDIAEGENLNDAK